jgi:hypothetical protein
MFTNLKLGGRFKNIWWHPVTLERYLILIEVKSFEV